MVSSDSDTVAVALWESVLTRWDEASVHESFLQACAEQNNLGFAATRYREVKEEGGPRQEFASGQLDKITAMALAQMSAMKSPPKDHKRGITIIAAVVSALLLAACIYLISL